ncbi:MAG TPA: hypothetical protein VKB68_12270 [Stellaceae bacterium]|nr:hypothetical protein [Stellaceae bacterium]
MRRLLADLAEEKFKELAELDFGHVVAVLITSVGFLLFLMSTIAVGSS